MIQYPPKPAPPGHAASAKREWAVTPSSANIASTGYISAAPTSKTNSLQSWTSSAEIAVKPPQGQPTTPDHTASITVNGETLETVESFCYLGDMIGQDGGCSDAVNTRVRSAWKKFRELLPILTNRSFSLNCRGDTPTRPASAVSSYMVLRRGQ